MRQHDRHQLAAGPEPVGDGVGDMLEILALVEGRVHDDALELAAMADGGVVGCEGGGVGNDWRDANRTRRRDAGSGRRADPSPDDFGFIPFAQ